MQEKKFFIFLLRQRIPKVTSKKADFRHLAELLHACTIYVSQFLQALFIKRVNLACLPITKLVDYSLLTLLAWGKNGGGGGIVAENKMYIIFLL